MKIYEIYFSPTGGTKKVADILAENLQGEIVPVDLTDHSMSFQNVVLEQEDVALVAVPSYGGRVPAVAVERLLKIAGNGSRAVLVCVYGNREYEDTLLELQDTVAEAGFHTIAAVSAIAEHSIARRFAKGRPDRQDQEQLLEFTKKIREKIAGQGMEKPEIPGNHPYKKPGNFGMVPKPNKACVNCGICARQCPVQVIDMANPQKVDSEGCISCMRCVSVCPHSARKLNPAMLAAVNLALKKVCSVRKECELFL